jgi:hypothetical protein
MKKWTDAQKMLKSSSQPKTAAKAWTIRARAGIRPIPDPPKPLLLHEPEGSLWRLRCDLTIQLRREEKQTHLTRSGAVAIAPAVVVRTG